MRVKATISMMLFAILTVAGVVMSISCGSGAMKLQGAGATFPEPVYNQWMTDYEKEANIGINYEGIGSGGGQKAIIEKTVDFAGSDAPMSAEDLDKNGLIQFPMIVGGIVPVINIPGIKSNQMRLTPDLLGRIFAGDITMWNHEDIAAVNEGLELPELPIVVVHRSDGSGTTWTFTYFLHKSSPYWLASMRGVKIDKETNKILEELDTLSKVLVSMERGCLSR